MDLDDGGVDHGVLHVRLVRTGLEESLEDIAVAPVSLVLLIYAYRTLPAAEASIEERARQAS